jgi:2-polyprenyl-3-methyl-5-hydroxy-6-metoxy-1,4-benzoquinol methylase
LVAAQRRSYEFAECIVCGHHDAAVVCDADDMRVQLEAVWAYHEARLRADIPTSRLADRVTFSQAPPLRLVECRDCGLVYRSPAERETALRDEYAENAPSPERLCALREAQLPMSRRQARRIRRLLRPGATGLEVGSYVGAFLVAASEAGLAFEGVDINSGVNAFARSVGARVHDGELRDFADDRSFDALTIWNAFDQLADPRTVAFDAWKRLRPGGVLALRVPNGAAYTRLHRRFTSGGRVERTVARAVLAQNNLLAFPYRWGFTIASISRLLADVGFSVVEIRGDVLVHTSDEWTRPWARWEERAVKRAIGVVARMRPELAPWLEVYARTTGERRTASGDRQAKRD